MLAIALALVIGNDPARAHSLSVSLESTHPGNASTVLDTAGIASISAEVATKSQLLVTIEATKTAAVKSEQVALATTDDGTLAKRQVVSTAGNATRDISTYTVQAGDTISSIASQFGITTSTVKWANDLSDVDFVSPGDTLTILPISGLLYTVQNGDTADSLAAKYQANAAQITSYNDAETKGLQPGSKIIIPDGISQEAPKPVSTPRAVASSGAAPKLTTYAGTGGGYSYGYCTYYVALRRAVPGNWGNANTWYYNAQISGFSVGSVPVAGAIAWTGAGYYGHVAYVESAGGGIVTISEMNGIAGWGRIDTRTVPASMFLYIY
jgi:surface antigen